MAGIIYDDGELVVSDDLLHAVLLVGVLGEESYTWVMEDEPVAVPCIGVDGPYLCIGEVLGEGQNTSSAELAYPCFKYLDGFIPKGREPQVVNPAIAMAGLLISALSQLKDFSEGVHFRSSQRNCSP